MILDQTKFLTLVRDGKTTPALKTFSDTILFYYLGYLAANDNRGAISEIGVGGSTFALTELSEKVQKSFYVFDCDAARLAIYCNTDHWPDADLKMSVCYSESLRTRDDVPDFSYCHADGSKDFEITVSDLEFYLEHLSVNGLICQDDYGNNKWPTVTDAVKKLEHAGKLKIVMVGDSSVWITRPEYYDYWIDKIACDTDEEFLILKDLCNIVDVQGLNHHTKYFFLQSLMNNKCSFDDYKDKKTRDYIDFLLTLSEVGNYLKMPYINQSKLGFALSHNNLLESYKITEVYDQIKGPTWPKTPMTKDEIESLPDWIKDELTNIHKIDIFEKISWRPNR